MARPRAPDSSSTSTSTVGFPRESSTSRPTTSTISLMLYFSSPRPLRFLVEVATGVTTVADVTGEPTTVETEPPRFNPFEPGFTDDPYPQFRALCEQNPVQQTPLGIWGVFGYD